MSNDPFSSNRTDNGSNFDERPTIDPSKNYLEELVGDGKKFRTTEDLARGKAESDAFIASLLREKQEMREEITRRMTVEDLLTSLKNPGQTPTNQYTAPTPQAPPSGAQGNQGTDSLDLETIKRSIKEDMLRESEESRKANNYRQVVDTLTEKLGSEVSAFLNTKAAELGVNLGYLKTLAEDKPDVLYTLLGVREYQKPKDVFNTPPSRINSTANPTSRMQIGEHKTQSYYENLKKKDFKEYMSQKTTLEMHKAMTALGDRFFDT